MHEGEIRREWGEVGREEEGAGGWRGGGEGGRMDLKSQVCT